MFTATAAEMVETDQPNSARSGSISSPGTARNAAAPTSARKVTAATHQAGWTRRSGMGALGVIGGATDAGGRPLYQVRTCTLDGGPVRTSAGYRVLPEHGPEILRTADTVV